MLLRTCESAADVHAMCIYTQFAKLPLVDNWLTPSPLTMCLNILYCRYDFDNTSNVSNESEGSIRGVYNVNMDSDIDLSMFADGNHSNSPTVAPTLYVENPIFPSHNEDSDDSYEAVRLATFTARPSPLPTPGGSPDSKTRQPTVDSDYSFPDPPMYATVDFAAKDKGRQSAKDALDEQADDILI